MENHNDVMTGTVVTFYSYKGGVGRSMALANVAYLLAESGKSVLCIDWDLEAPGLERYFNDLNPIPPAPEYRGGLLGVLELATVKNVGSWENFVGRASTPTNAIHFLSSGEQASDYRKRLAEFKWDHFFAERRGGELIEALRDAWKAAYDYVLIDSRTGLSDAAGICTIQLPDILVLMFSANEQSVDGSHSVATAVRRNRSSLPYDRAFLPIIPILSRFDEKEESDRAADWKKRIALKFDAFFRDWLPRRVDPQKMLAWTCLPYVPRYSFGEALAVKEQGTSEPQLLGYYYYVLFRLLATRLREVRSILVAIGITDAAAEPLLPDDDGLRAALRADTTYARRKLDEICDFAAEDLAMVIAALRRLADESERLQRLSDSEEIIRRSTQLSHSFGADRPEQTAQLITQHAGLLCKMGRRNEGEAKYKEVLNFVENTFGKGERLSQVLAEFAAFLEKNERIKEAEDCHRAALKCAEAAFNPGDTRLAANLVVFAKFLSDAGEKLNDVSRKTEAIESLNRAIAIFRSTALTPEAAYDAALDTALQRLHQLFADLGRYEESLSPAAELVQRIEARKHKDLRALCDALEQHGWALELFKGQYAEAESLYRRSLAIKEKNWGADSITFGLTCLKLAEVLSLRGNYDEAGQICERALRINETNLGDNHPETANVLATLAELQSAQGSLAEAEQYLRRATAIRECAFGLGHRWVALSYNHLGLFLGAHGHLREAEELHRKAMEIDLKNYGSNHPEVAFDQLCLAGILSAGGRTDEAEQLWLKGFPLFEHAHGANHEEVARKRVEYAQHLARTDRLEIAEAEIARAVSVLKNSLGAGHPHTKNAEEISGRIRQRLHQLQSLEI
ncbi:MAG TPA: tetratricopeptide repeat protein [Chthoniobacteraceae bacterium]|jgi:tetratricopeptide (TPR) repeat protein/cellulose biosynthesis protein BcsQ